MRRGLLLVSVFAVTACNPSLTAGISQSVSTQSVTESSRQFSFKIADATEAKKYSTQAAPDVEPRETMLINGLPSQFVPNEITIVLPSGGGEHAYAQLVSGVAATFGGKVIKSVYRDAPLTASCYEISLPSGGLFDALELERLGKKYGYTEELTFLSSSSAAFYTKMLRVREMLSSFGAKVAPNYAAHPDSHTGSSTFEGASLYLTREKGPTVIG